VRDCDSVPAEALMGELGKELIIKRANITDKAGTERPQLSTTLQGVIRVSDNCASWLRECSLSCDARPVGAIFSNIAPIPLVNCFKLGFACSLYFLGGLGLSASIL
jgi:hypothetical protein